MFCTHSLPLGVAKEAPQQSYCLHSLGGHSALHIYVVIGLSTY
jgi:hypothetical protein